MVPVITKTRKKTHTVIGGEILATLQDIGTNVQAIHKSLEQGQSYLLACVASCKQYADQIRSGIDGTKSHYII